MSNYAWLITTDHITEPGYRDDKGTTGPSAAPAGLLHDLECGDGETFIMKDDDGILYYTGRIVGSYDGDEPLYDFGMPNAGCTSCDCVGGKDVL